MSKVIKKNSIREIKQHIYFTFILFFYHDFQIIEVILYLFLR